MQCHVVIHSALYYTVVKSSKLSTSYQLYDEYKFNANISNYTFGSVFLSFKNIYAVVLFCYDTCVRRV